MLLSDTIIIGNIIGEAGISGMNMVVPLISAINFISITLSFGTSVLYSRAIGSFDKDKANRIFGMAIILAGICSLFFICSTSLLEKNYFDFYGALPSAREQGEKYFSLLRFSWLFLPMQQS